LPKAETMLADRGYDADWFRAALVEKGLYAQHPAKEKPKNTRRIRQGTL
jgi:hypothetical protein